MEEPRFEEVEHTADWALRVRGRTMADLCQVAASAMLAACGARAETGPEVRRTIRIEAPDRETLLVQWLEEVLYALDVRNRMPARIEASQPDPGALSVTWWERPLAGIEKPIKAVTFHDLAVDEVDEGLEATIVFDV